MLAKYDELMEEQEIPEFYRMVFLKSLKLLVPGQQQDAIRREMELVANQASHYQRIRTAIYERDGSSARDPATLRRLTYQVLDRVFEWKREVKTRNRLIENCVFLWHGRNYLAQLREEVAETHLLEERGLQRARIQNYRKKLFSEQDCKFTLPSL